MLIVLNSIKLQTILMLVIRQSQTYITMFLLFKPLLVHSDVKVYKLNRLHSSYSYFIKKILYYFFDIIFNKCVRLSFIFFELELFFITYSLFIFIFFIYSIFNRLLYIFLFVIICIKVELRTLFYTKTLFPLTSIVYLNSLIKKLVIVFFIFFF